MRRKMATRRLGFEGLENRRVMTGNVTAGLDVSGNLVITGDAGDNHVAIWQGAFNNILVAGGKSAGTVASQTNINGQAGVIQFANIAGIIINMNDGNDRVVITKQTINGNVAASLNNGNDQLALVSSPSSTVPFVANDGITVAYGKVSVINGFARVNGNAGNDTFAMFDANVAGDVVNFGGNGNDTFTQSGSTATQNRIGGSLKVAPGAGDDVTNANRLRITGGININDGDALTQSVLTMTNVQAQGNATIFMSIRRDIVTLQGEGASAANQFSAKNVAVFTGNGNDSLNVTNASTTYFKTDTGAGEDAVNVQDSIFNKLDVLLSDSNDSLIAGGVTVNTKATFDGGLGSNVYTDQGGNSYGVLVRTNI